MVEDTEQIETLEEQLDYIIKEQETNVRGQVRKGNAPQDKKARNATTWEQIKPLIDASSMDGKITRANVIESDWNYLQKHCSNTGPIKLSYQEQRKNALQKAKEGVPGSLTIKEARIVHRVKQTEKDR